ncbi:hypothetical protein ACFL1X_05370 [Candidatus Hydrogenedentota bacterium]
MNENNTPEKPEINFKVGAVRAAIWKRTRTNRDGTIFQTHKVVLDRTYKDKEGQWKHTTSFDVNDVPKAVLALEKAYDYLLSKPGEKSGDVECETLQID